MRWHSVDIRSASRTLGRRDTEDRQHEIFTHGRRTHARDTHDTGAHEPPDIRANPTVSVGVYAPTRLCYSFPDAEQQFYQSFGANEN